MKPCPLVGPYGACPSCDEPLARHSMSCGDDNGHCMVLHDCYKCCGCGRFFERVVKFEERRPVIGLDRVFYRED
jgi:hypothetical protein